jgi:hypothetical protein
MIPRKVSCDDRLKGLAVPLAFQQTLPKALRRHERFADNVGRYSLFGSELAVYGAVSQTALAGNRINTGGTDATLAEQARGRGQYLLAILRRLFLRNPHEFSRPASGGPVLTRFVTRVINLSNMTSVINIVTRA